MSFWEKATGVAQTPAPAPVAPQVYPQQGYPQVPQQYVQQPGYPQVPQDDEAKHIQAAQRLAKSSRSNLECPNCFSGNIQKPSPNVMERCYECGWNPRFEQSTAGAGMPSGNGGPATPARQISTANNYNPQMVVDTVRM